MSSSCVFPYGPFNQVEIFGLSALNIVMMIIFTTYLNRVTKIPSWILIVPVAFVLYKAFCLDTIFFNREKTGAVSGVLSNLKEV
jgi:hypothetical protein